MSKRKPQPKKPAKAKAETIAQEIEVNKVRSPRRQTYAGSNASEVLKEPDE